jgi:high mobility group protein B3
MNGNDYRELCLNVSQSDSNMCFLSTIDAHMQRSLSSSVAVEGVVGFLLEGSSGVSAPMNDITEPCCFVGMACMDCAQVFIKDHILVNLPDSSLENRVRGTKSSIALCIDSGGIGTIFESALNAVGQRQNSKYSFDTSSKVLLGPSVPIEIDIGRQAVDSPYAQAIASQRHQQAVLLALANAPLGSVPSPFGLFSPEQMSHAYMQQLQLLMLSSGMGGPFQMGVPPSAFAQASMMGANGMMMNGGADSGASALHSFAIAGNGGVHQSRGALSGSGGSISSHLYSNTSPPPLPNAHASNTSLHDDSDIEDVEEVDVGDASEIASESEPLNRKSSSKKRDPNLPRGFVTAFNIFAKEKRAELIQGSLGKSGDNSAMNVNTILGKMWHAQGPKERHHYYLLAEADKIRYLKEMEQYKPAAGFEKQAPRLKVRSDLGSSTEFSGKRKRGYSVRLRKHPDAPRRPRSAYMCFVKKNREQVRVIYPEIGFADIGQKLGELWRQISDEERGVYQAESLADKRRYADEMKAYNLHADAADGSDVEGREGLTSSNDSISTMTALEEGGVNSFTGGSRKRDKLSQSVPELGSARHNLFESDFSESSSVASFNFGRLGESEDLSSSLLRLSNSSVHSTPLGLGAHSSLFDSSSGRSVGAPSSGPLPLSAPGAGPAGPAVTAAGSRSSLNMSTASISALLSGLRTADR